MRVYESQYEGVQWVGETIQFIMELPQLSSLVDNIPQPNKKWSLCPPLANWTDILACQPNCYLQLALTMDFSFSQGRLPSNGDFSPKLQELFSSPTSKWLENTELGVAEVEGLEVQQDDLLFGEIPVETTQGADEHDYFFDEWVVHDLNGYGNNEILGID